MLDIRLLREQPDFVKATLAKAGVEGSAVDAVLAFDEKRRGVLAEVERLKATRNTVSKEISTLKDAEVRNTKIAEMRVVGDQISALDKQVAELEAAQQAAILDLRNLPHESVPVGADEEGNVVLQTIGTPRQFDFTPRP
ncbi:MAG: serine--tRNA ligase, partial [Chloroflexota bacterium]